MSDENENWCPMCELGQRDTDLACYEAKFSVLKLLHDNASHFDHAGLTALIGRMAADQKKAMRRLIDGE